MKDLKGYSKTISEAINVTDINVINQVEDLMRNIIFQSTLDWQSKAQFNKGAREAYELYLYMNSEEGKQYMAQLSN